MIAQVTLEPCPFCGGDAEMRTADNVHYSFGCRIACKQCCVDITYIGSDLDSSGIKSRCIAAWNRRAGELALQSQLDATNEGAWAYERQLNAALKSLQEIADMRVGDQPAALAHYSEADWVRRHAVMMQHIAVTAVKAIVADEGAKPSPVETAAEIIGFGRSNDIPTASIVERLISAGHLRPGSK